jgi:hypothetical protein
MFKTIALIINILIIILEIFTLHKLKRKLDMLKFYTYLQNLLTLIVSIVLVIYLTLNLLSNTIIPEYVRGLRYIVTCGLVSTTFIFVVFLGAGKKLSITEDDFKKGLSPKLANVILHYICPLLSIISFIFFEKEILLNNGIWTLIVALPSCLYWIVYILLSTTKKWKEPYNFSTNKVLEILTYILIPISFIVFSIILWNVK